MKINKGIFRSLTVLSVLPLAGCYSNVNLDKYRDGNGENLLVVNSIINPDSTVAVLATRTYFFSDIHDERDYVTDLDMTLSVNGESRGAMRYDSGSGLYRSEVIPEAGDQISISTVYDGVEVSGCDIVPRKAVIRSVKASRTGPIPISWGEEYIVTYEITFIDEPGEENYYFLDYDENYPEDYYTGNLMMGERDYTYEYVFQELARNISSNIPGWEPYSPDGLPFSDYGIDGKEHTLVVKEKITGSNLHFGGGRMRRRFQLFSISKDYYQYLLSVLYNYSNNDGLHGGLIDIGLSQPMRYFSNISGGVGIFAAYSLDTVVIDVLEQTGPFRR